MANRQHATLLFDGSDFEGVRAFGAQAPELGYYEAEILDTYREDGDDPDSIRIDVRLLPSGYTALDWGNLYRAADGTRWPGLEDRQFNGRRAKWKSVYLSAGYNEAQINDHVNKKGENWLIKSQNGGKSVFVAWAPSTGGQPVGQVKDYGAILGYITPEDCARYKANNQVPQDTRQYIKALRQLQEGNLAAAVGGGAVGALPPMPGTQAGTAPIPGGGQGLPPLPPGVVPNNGTGTAYSTPPPLPTTVAGMAR